MALAGYGASAKVKMHQLIGAQEVGLGRCQVFQVSYRVTNNSSYSGFLGGNGGSSLPEEV